MQAAGTRPGGSGYTIADGIAVKEPGDLTMGILGETLDDIVVVEDEQIAEAIVLLAERTKLVVEGAGAVSVAAMLGGLVGGSGPVRRASLRRQHRRLAHGAGDAARARARRPLPRAAHPAFPTGPASSPSCSACSPRSA